MPDHYYTNTGEIDMDPEDLAARFYPTRVGPYTSPSKHTVALSPFGRKNDEQ